MDDTWTKRETVRSGMCALTLLSLGLSISVSGVSGQAMDVERQAVYTQMQAATGSQVYGEVCAACHLLGLQGSSEAPELAGPKFPHPMGDPLRVGTPDVCQDDDAASRPWVHQ